jgi:hypothetical protein
MDTINPQILPSTLSKKEHHRAAIVGLWVLAVALLVGAIYWFGLKNQSSSVPTSGTTSQPHDEILSAIRSSSATVTQEDTDRVTERLSGNTTVSAEQEGAVLEQLKSE